MTTIPFDKIDAGVGSSTVDVPVVATPVTGGSGGGAGGGLTNQELRVADVEVDVKATVGLTNTQLRASAVPVSGPLTNAELRAAAVPVSHGGLTNAELRASAVPVSHSGLTDAQLRAAAVPVSGPATNAELRATPLPVSTGGLTDAQLRATPLTTKALENATQDPITTQNLVPAGVATANSAVAVSVDNGCSEIGIQVSGTYTGALSAQATIDGTNWVTLPTIINRATGASSATIASGTVGLFSVPNHGYSQVRVTGLAAITGSAVVDLRAASGTGTADSMAANAAVVTIVGGVAVVGAGAASSPVAGAPIRVASRAATGYDSSLINQDTSDLVATLTGAVITRPYSLPEHDWQTTMILTTAAATSAKGAGPAGVRNYVTGFQYQNTSATATEVQILDGATVIARFHAPANMALPAAIAFRTPLRGTAVTALNALTVTAAANVYVNVQGYQAP